MYTFFRSVNASQQGLLMADEICVSPGKAMNFGFIFSLRMSVAAVSAVFGSSQCCPRGKILRFS